MNRKYDLVWGLLVLLLGAGLGCAHNFKNASVEWTELSTERACTGDAPFRVEVDGSPRCTGRMEAGYCAALGRMWKKEFTSRMAARGCDTRVDDDLPTLVVNLTDITVEGGPYNAFNALLTGGGVVVMIGGVLFAALKDNSTLELVGFIGGGVAGLASLLAGGYRLTAHPTDFAVTTTADVRLVKDGVTYWTSRVHGRRVEAYSAQNRSSVYFDSSRDRYSKPVISRMVEQALHALNKKIVETTTRMNHELRKGKVQAALTR